MTTILVVEDSEIIRDKLAGILTAAKYQVITAVDGRDGLSKAVELTTIAAVVTDYNMPNKNGVEMLRELRTVPTYANTPFIMLTTEAGSTLKKLGLEVGVRAWLNKPINEVMLLKVLEKLIQLQLAA